MLSKSRLTNPSRLVVLLTLFGLLAFRIAYGLSLDFWSDDERQIYLNGLVHFATGQWPFFGPDVVHTDQQIAGALQSLLISLPLRVAAEPESPYILINIISFLSLLLLGEYVSRRFYQLPRLVVMAWLLTLPWTLNLSTNVYNPSYVLPGACLFFVGLFEALPALHTGLLREGAAFAALGFGLAWCAQFHLSWPLLVPFLILAFIQRIYRRLATWRAVVGLTVGLLVGGSTLLPTLIKYGVGTLVAPLLSNSSTNYSNISQGFTILARYLSLAAYELPRFLIEDADLRLAYLRVHPWLVPSGVCLVFLGLLQPLICLWGLLRRPSSGREWPIRTLVYVSALGLYLAFCLSSRPPTARNYYILMPIAALAMVQGCLRILGAERLRQWAVLAVLLSLLYHSLLAGGHYRDLSLYRRRDLVSAAIKTRQWQLLGERRSFAVSGGRL